MTDEQKNPEEETFADALAEEEEKLGEKIPIMMADEDADEQPTTSYDLDAEEAGAEELEAQADNALEAGVANAIEASADVAENSGVVQAVNNAVEGAVEAIDKASREATDLTEENHHSDTFTVPMIGNTMTLPGGIYTFIFLVLGALTIFEVAIAEILPSGNPIAVTILVVASLAKAVLVVAFYMHLRTDNPLFRVVLILPVLIVLISVLYLLGVPVGGGLGYQ